MRVTNGVLNLRHWPFAPFDAGWSSPVARQAHNLKAAGSNPAPATKLSPLDQSFGSRLTGFFIDSDSFEDQRRNPRNVPKNGIALRPRLLLILLLYF
jgi:hypothetical protein